MDTRINHKLEPDTDLQNVKIVSVRGDSYSGPSEISTPSGRTGGTLTGLGAEHPYIDSEVQRQFDIAVDSCRAVNSRRGYFHKRKTNVVGALDPAYLLYRTVRACPELEVQLRQLDILKERKRRLGRDKTCLACMYVSMQPNADEDYKDCSAYAAYLLQAEFENKEPDEFKDWARTARLKECLRDVRARKRAVCSKEPSDDSTPDLDLSIRRRAKGVRGSLDGDKFGISDDTLAAILKLIEIDRSENTLAASKIVGGDDA